jgi:hypothetical protein
LKKLLILTLLGGLFLSVSSHYFGAALDGDVGCFDAIVHQMKMGQSLYTDVYDNKAPGIFYLTYFTPPPPPFSSITGSWIIQCICLAILLVALGRLFYNLIISHLLVGICAVLFLLFSLRTILFFWPAFFVGGYTEEIGSYLFIGGFVLLYQVSSFWVGNHIQEIRLRRFLLIASGLLIGTAILIKEPFILFTPAIILWFHYLKRKEVGFWFVGLVCPWLLHLITLLKNDSLQGYIQYLRFAFNYSNAEKSLLNPERWECVVQPFQFDSLPVVNVIQVFVFLGFCLLLLYRGFLKNSTVSKAVQVKMDYSVAILFLTHLFFLAGAKCFGILGNGGYLHYQIPEYLFSWLGLLLFLQCISLQLQSLNGTRKYEVGLIVSGSIVILFISNSLVKCQMPMGHSSMFQTLANPHFINGSNYPKLIKVKDEEMVWNNFLVNNKIELPKRSQIYIDDPHLGRFYGYLNSQYLTYFPCPYWVFFDGDNLNFNQQAWPFLEQNRNKIIRQLQEQPPEFVLTSDNKGPLGTFTELMVFFKENFVKRGEFLLDTKRVLLYERVHSKLPEDSL